MFLTARNLLGYVYGKFYDCTECKHKFSTDKLYTSYPPQVKCPECGELFTPPEYFVCRDARKEFKENQ